MQVDISPTMVLLHRGKSGPADISRSQSGLLCRHVNKHRNFPPKIAPSCPSFSARKPSKYAQGAIVSEKVIAWAALSFNIGHACSQFNRLPGFMRLKLSQSKKSNFSHVHKNILSGPVSVINRNQICRHQVSFQRPQRYFWRLQLFGELRSARGHSCGRQYWSPPGRVMTPTVCNCSKYATTPPQTPRN